MEKEFNFTPFYGKNTKALTDFISVTKTGVFGMSSGFCKKYKIIENFTYTLILWDKDKKVVAFLFIPEGKEVTGSFKLAGAPSDKTRNSCSVSAGSWFRENGLNIAEFVGQYRPHEYNDSKYGKVYYIDLNEKRK